MKSKLKVALVMPTHFNIHSSLRNFIKSYEYLIDNKNVEVTLFTDSKNNISLEKFKVEKIKGFDYGNVLEKVLFVLGVPRYFYPGLSKKLKGFDVIAANNPEFYAYAFQSYKAAKKYGARLVLRTSQTVDGFFFYKFLKFFVNPLVKPAYSYAKYNIFSNPQAEERCLRLGLIDDKDKSVITGHATDTDIFQPKKVEKKKRRTLLSVGGLLELKGHHLIIESLKELVKKGEDVELKIVGEGHYRKDLETLAKKLGIGDRVKLLGNKDHDELVGLYNEADVFVLANFQEITPAVNEALACETPVVVMECGGREFVIPDESYGLVSRKFDVEDLTRKIALVLDDNKLASDIAKKGRKRILENFTIEKVANKFYKAFMGNQQ